jgi:hypothetical protein
MRAANLGAVSIAVDSSVIVPALEAATIKTPEVSMAFNFQGESLVDRAIILHWVLKELIPQVESVIVAV